MTRAWIKADERRWFAAVGDIDICVLCHRWGTQVSHRNEGRGLGQKSAPWHTAAICPDCHHEIDNGHRLTQQQRRELHRKAVRRTHEILRQRGTIPACGIPEGRE